MYWFCSYCHQEMPNVSLKDQILRRNRKKLDKFNLIY